MYKFNPYAIPQLITALFCLFIGIFVYLKNRRSSANVAFGLLGFSCFIWCLGYFMAYLSTSESLAFFWCKFAYVGVIFITPSTYHFSVSFAHLKNQRKIIPIFYCIAGVFLWLLKDGYVVGNVGLHPWGYHTRVGISHNAFFISWVMPLFLAFRNLYLGYKNAKLPLERQRAKYMFWAVLFGFFGGVDFLAHYGVNIYPFGFMPVVLFILATAYAIVRYRLMDITVAITRTSIFLAVYTLVLGLPFVLSTAGRQWLYSLLEANWWIGPLVLMATLGIAGPFVYIYLRRSAEAILFREQRRYQKVLAQAAEEMTRILSLKKLLNFIAHTVTKTVRISHAAIYLYDERNERFILKAGRNLNNGQPQSIDKQSPLITLLKEQRNPLVYEEIKRKAQEGSPAGYIFEKLENEMQNLNTTVAVPSFLEDELLGIIILGDKRSGRIYSSEDLNTFLVLASQFALAIENASLYNDIEEQVNQRTKELNEVQKQLVQAEKLASVGTLAGGVAHEINNPLTAILTNVQMLLLDAGSLGPECKESLELIEEATKRCRTIVQKLMSYARKPLEAIEVSNVDVLVAVNNAVSFLSYQFEQENIAIRVHAEGEGFLVRGNQNELEQVVTNIVLNARDAIKRIKKSGTVDIILLKNGEWVRVEIKDDGIGIPREIISKIFDPFFTTKDIGKGLGLGLSICQAIVSKYNGLITVRSEPNRGSIFTIQFPRFVEAVVTNR